MTPKKEKDNLTDLADDVSADNDKPEAAMSDGQVTIGDDTVVTLGVDDEEITKVAKELLDAVK
jgi:hypothetical protein